MIEQDYNNILKTVGDLEDLIKELDQFDSERGLVDFSTDDKLRNVNLSLAQLIQDSSDLSDMDSQRKAEEIVEEIKVDIKKIDDKQKICAVFNALTDNIDSISTGTISGVIAALVISGNLALPAALSNPAIGIPVCIWILLRLRLAYYCSDN